MDRTTAGSYQIPEGAEVRSADGDKLGKVVAVQGNYLVVEKGFFFPTDYYVPTSAINTFDGGTVYLNVGKDQALAQGWDQIPTTDGYYADATATTAAAGQQPFEHGANAAQTHLHADDRIVVPVHEEELTATKHAVERGRVVIDKDIIAEERTLDVPVTEERVVVQRRAVDREAGADATAFQEGTIEVPLRGEEVDVQKRVRVAEEVEVGKEAVQRTERVAGTVHREEVRVDDTSATGAYVDDATRRDNI